MCERWRRSACATQIIRSGAATIGTLATRVADHIGCVYVGEVRAPSDPRQSGPGLVIDVAELVWEPIAG
jgi:hypothetical protein